MSLDDTLEHRLADEPSSLARDNPWTRIATCADLAAQAIYPVVAIRDDAVFIYGGDGANAVASSADGATWTMAVGNWPARETTSGAALDGQLYLVGGFTGAKGSQPARGYGDTWVSDDGRTWTQIGGDAPWGVRWAHTVLPLRGHLFMIGGVAGPSYSSDVWALEPEGTWRMVTTGQFRPRAWAAGAVLGRTLMVMGGYNDADHAMAETLVSRDAGLTWTAYKSPFPARHSAVAMTLGDTVYLIGGVDDLPYRTAYADVWATKDGVLWTLVDRAAPAGSAAAPFGARVARFGGGPDVLALSPPPLGWREAPPLRPPVDNFYNPITGSLGGKFYAWAGNQGNQVWRSDDGLSWQALGGTNLPGRQFMAGVVHHGWLFASGGGGAGGVESDEVYRSRDGVTWSQVATGPRWRPRQGHCMASWKGKLWVFGGDVDVWFSEDDGVSWQVANPHAFEHSVTDAKAVVFGDELFMLGGQGWQEVQVTRDGVTWQTYVPPWSARYQFGAAVVGGTLYVIRGLGNGRGAFADVWATADGRTWRQVDSAAPYPNISSFGAVVAGDEIIVFGGSSGDGHSSSRVLVYRPPQLPPP